MLDSVAEVVSFDKPGIHGFLHHPEQAEGRGLVLTHGAGGNCTAPLLVAAGNAFAEVGLFVLRCDLPFRQRRPTGPPSPATAATDRAGLRSAVMAMREVVSGAVFLGGQSYGGRQATMLAADEPALVAGLLLFSYPLHPPRKPDRRRTEHFPQLQVPGVFVQGTADSFGGVEEIRAALALIPAATRLIAIEGASHDLKRGRFDLGLVVAALLDEA
jgi:predicted alpha/beta-hydrolase family hydrolase